MVGISLLSADNADHFGIGDLLEAIIRNVLVANDLEGIGAFDTLTCVSGVGAGTLVKATEFVGV